MVGLGYHLKQDFNAWTLSIGWWGKDILDRRAQPINPSTILFTSEARAWLPI
jgi:hypothetical protein